MSLRNRKGWGVERKVRDTHTHSTPAVCRQSETDASAVWCNTKQSVKAVRTWVGRVKGHDFDLWDEPGQRGGLALGKGEHLDVAWVGWGWGLLGVAHYDK
jgi:hypothetical protein